MKFDGEKCIELLKDKSLGLADRIAAAESLIYYPKQQSYDALKNIIIDDSEESELREEAVECLGYLCYEMGINQKHLNSIPEPYKSEVIREIELNKDAEQKKGSNGVKP